MDNLAATAPLAEGEQRATACLQVTNAKGMDAALEEYFRGDVLRPVYAAVVDDQPIVNPEPAAVVRLRGKAQEMWVVRHQHAGPFNRELCQSAQLGVRSE